MRRSKQDSQVPALSPDTPDPDQAWRVLGLVNDWLKHAEAKLGILLAAAGVAGGLLYNLYRNQTDAGAVFNVAATLSAVAVLFSGLLAMVGLLPIVKGGRGKAGSGGGDNPLFFGDIAGASSGQDPRYEDRLLGLVRDPVTLVQHIAQQAQANAVIAARKYRWAKRSLACLLVSLVGLAAAAAATALSW